MDFVLLAVICHLLTTSLGWRRSIGARRYGCVVEQQTTANAMEDVLEALEGVDVDTKGFQFGFGKR